MSSQTNVYLL